MPPVSSCHFLYKLDALRLLLRSFWDKSRAVVATWKSRSIASDFWPFTYAFAKQATKPISNSRALKM